MGKGDTPRPLSIPREEYEKNYEAVFGRREIKTWNPDLATCCECGRSCPVAEMLPAYNLPESDPICAQCLARKGIREGFFTRGEADDFLADRGLSPTSQSHPQEEDLNDREQQRKSSTNSGDGPPEEGSSGSPSVKAD